MIDNDVLEEVHYEAGRCLFLGQLFEIRLRQMAALVSEITGKNLFGKKSNEDVYFGRGGLAFTAIIKKLEENFEGQYANKILGALEKAIEDRNYVVHHFYIENGNELKDKNKADVLSSRLRLRFKSIKRGYQQAGLVNKKLYATLGIDIADLQAQVAAEHVIEETKARRK